MTRTSFATVLALFLLMFTPAAHAQYELNEATFEKGEVELEYRGQYHSGNPNRKFIIEDGEIEGDENEIVRQRHQLEIEFGLTDRFKLSTGIEWEQERFDDIDGVSMVNAFGHVEPSSIEFEGTYILLPMTSYGLAVAGYGALEMSTDSAESNVWRIGTFLQGESGRWSALANIVFAKSFGGDEPGENSDDRWDFEFAGQIGYEMSDRITVAMEGYATVTRLGSSGSPSEVSLEFGDQNQYSLGPAIYFKLDGLGLKSAMAAKANDDDDDASGKDDDDDEGGVTLSVGAFFGLNDDTPDTVLRGGLAAEF